jgi:tetratricopeptide (TPR) repeat protein
MALKSDGHGPMSDLHQIARPKREEPKADVVFVPGLGGDPFKTWQHSSKREDSWPYWLAEEVPEVQVLCLAYPADWTHWFGGEAMSLFDRAKSVLNLMAAFELGRRPIVFICHSLGGLVVKQLLREAADPGAEPTWQAIGKRTRGVAFVATPHAGADLARTAERLGLVTQATPVMADLTAHAPALRGLNEWFRGYVTQTGLRVLCYYETRTTGTKRVGWLGRVVSAGVKVVEEADADPGLAGVTPVPLDADHLGTYKPNQRNRPLCKDLVGLVQAVLNELMPGTGPGVPSDIDRSGPLTTAPVGKSRAMRATLAEVPQLDEVNHSREEKIKVFFSYSRADESVRDELEKYLAPLKYEKLIDTWHDRKIEPGTEWDEEIDRRLREADLILLLVSADFLNSKYAYEKELRHAIERHEKGEARVIPIAVRPANWKLAPFAKLQGLPPDMKPIMRHRDREAAFAGVVEGIHQAVLELAEQRSREGAAGPFVAGSVHALHGSNTPSSPTGQPAPSVGVPARRKVQMEPAPPAVREKQLTGIALPRGAKAERAAPLDAVPAGRDRLSPTARSWEMGESSTNQTLLQYAPAPRRLRRNEAWNVFLSYRSVDRPWVLNLYDVLRSAGHKVFLDQVVLKAGDELVRQLENGLERSQAGVLIWSAESAQSDWMRREYSAMEAMAGSKKGFCFVPVRVDHKELPLFTRNRVFLDFSAYPDGPNGGELLRLLHAVVGQPLSDASVRFAAELDRLTQEAANRIKAARMNGDAQRLRRLFEGGGLPWEMSSTLGCQAADALLNIDEPQAALEMLEQIEQLFPRAIRPKQLRAQALAQIGGADNLGQAQEIIGALYAQDERDPETVEIYAGTFMDRYAASGNVLMLRRSRDLYEEAFANAADNYHTGINAAAKSVFLGTEADLRKAEELAGRVQEIVGDKPVIGDYWLSATVAEVQLIQGNFERAAELYSAAVAMAPFEIAAHRSTWRQTVRLMKRLSPTPEQYQVVRQAFAHLSEPEAEG